MTTPPTSILLLIGPRGSGKTTVGVCLAERLGRLFIDTDVRVLQRFDEVTVSEVWQTHGESAWRAAETQVMREILTDDVDGGVVCALGGGAPMIDEVADLIDGARQDGRAVVVYLRGTPETLRTRLTDETSDRPSLTGADPLDEIGDVLAARESTYVRLSDTIIEIDSGAVDEIINAIITG